MAQIKSNEKSFISAALVLTTLLITIFLNEFHFFSRVELASFDHRVSMFRSDKTIHEDVIVVLIDEESLQHMANEFGRWPWPRAAYEDLLEFFHLAGAEAFGFDILFVEQEESGGINDNDQRLIKATEKAGNVVHAMQLLENLQPGAQKQLPEDFIRQHQVEGIDFKGKTYNDYLIPLPDLYRASRDVGYLEIEPDRDGVFRRIRLFNQFNEQSVFPALSTALVAPLVSSGTGMVSHDDRAIIGDIEIPLEDGQYLMNPYGGMNTFSAKEVFMAMKQIRAGEQENLILDPRDFRNKIVLLGASAIGLLDVKPTAYAAKEAGVFMHAYTVSNILLQDFLQRISAATTYLLCGLLAAISVVSVIFIPRLFLGASIPLVLGLVYLIVGYAAFSANLLFNLSPVLFAIGLSLLLALSYRTYSEKLGKQKVRTMLGQYVSPGVLTHVIDNYDTLSAEVGSNETLSILFSDIRGFTNISENRAAPEVVDMLNIYFSEMTDIIFDHDGTLDKFIGDAIMAFWGAPIKSDDHAEQAVETAIMMRNKLTEINAKLRDRGYDQIDIGIGIHTGKVVLGNIGSAKKLDYTIIGDSVNLASRIEGITKQYDVPLIISEDTYHALPPGLPCIVVDAVRLKGKQHPIKLYTPATTFVLENEIDMPVTDLINLAEDAFERYQKARWNEALHVYKQCPSCSFFKIMTDRCTRFIDQEPMGDWDGVYTHATK